MKQLFALYISCLPFLFCATTSCLSAKKPLSEKSISWLALPDLPDRANKQLGVSAPFAGIHHGMLLVGGGCNFPDIPVAEGGTKKYYADTYALDITKDTPGKWQGPFQLPYAVAYGATVSVPEGVICIGGNNQNDKFSTVFLLQWDTIHTCIRTDTLPSLPVAIDNMAATHIGRDVYVVGGNINGVPSGKMYRLSLERMAKGWVEMPGVPGNPRLQLVASTGIIDNEMQLVVASGYAPSLYGSKPEVSTDVLAFAPSSGQWKIVSTIPPHTDQSPRSFVGGCAVTYGNKQILFMGGTNYTQFLSALNRDFEIQKADMQKDSSKINRLKEESKNYLLQPIEWYAFNTSLLVFDSEKKTWRSLGEYPQLARAGAQAVLYKNNLFIVNGETKPGIRTPQVNKLIYKE